MAVGRAGRQLGKVVPPPVRAWRECLGFSLLRCAGLGRGGGWKGGDQHPASDVGRADTAKRDLKRTVNQPENGAAFGALLGEPRRWPIICLSLD